jgi:hypothetical protein
LNSLYEAATTEVSRAEIARAALATVIAWLGWLRALELFSLTWNDLTVLELLGPRWISLMELEPFWLDFCRKPSLAKRSPLMWFWLTPRHLVYRLASGPTVFDRLWAIKPSHQIGTPWTSHFFRSTYLWRMLHMQRIAGDAHLKPFDGVNGNKTLEQVFYSMHSYRRGARSVVSKSRPFPMNMVGGWSSGPI